MATGEYLAGLAIFAGTLGAAAGVATVVIRRQLGHLAGAPRVVAWGVAFLAAVLAAHLLPGVLGVLTRWTALGAAVLILVAVALALPGREPAAIESEPDPAASGPLSWLLAAVAVGTVGVLLLAGVWDAARHPSESVDTLTFHLPNIAAWIRGHSLWQVDQFVPVWSLGNYPQNGDVAFLATVMPWRDDAFAKLAQVPFVLLLAGGVYALALELRARRATAAICAALVPAIPLAGKLAVGTTMPDLFLAAGFVAGALFLKRSFRTGLTSELVLAGVALGLAFGAKWNGVTTVVVAVAVWAVAWLLVRRPAGLLARRGLVLAGAIAGAGGFWLLRNWVQSGNPIIPVRVHAFGATIFGAPPDEIRRCTGWRIVDYTGDGHIWSTYFWPGWRDSLGAPAAAALAGGVLAAVLAVRRQGSRAVGAVLACAALLVAVYAVTPYSALGPKGQPVVVGLQSRYVLPALALAAAAAAWGVGRLGRFRLAGEAVLVLCVLDGARLAFDVPAGRIARTLLVVVVVAMAAVVVRLAAVTLGRPQLRGRAGVVAAAALCALVMAVEGRAIQRDFDHGRYAHQDSALTWLRLHAAAGHRVALAGQWNVNGIPPVLPAFGPGFHNAVGYPARSVQRVLRPYTRPGPWLAALHRGRYDLVIVGNAVAPPGSCFIPGTRTDWNAWARAARLRVVARSARLTVYRVRPEPGRSS